VTAAGSILYDEAKRLRYTNRQATIGTDRAPLISWIERVQVFILDTLKVVFRQQFNLFADFYRSVIGCGSLCISSRGFSVLSRAIRDRCPFVQRCAGRYR
jgi:hypothetical protein